MGVFSLFGGSSKPDYETLLSGLSGDIEEVKVHLSEIRLRERRWSLLVNAYGVAIWAVWVGLWWIRALPLGLFRLSGDSVEGKAIGIGGIAAGPFLIWLLNRALHFIFTRQRNSSENRLRDLLTKQRKHLDEIKKATNYDSTRKLIERYDDTPPASPSHGPAGRGMGGPLPGSVPSTPVRSSPRTPSKQPNGTPRAGGQQTGPGSTPLRPPDTPILVAEGLNPEQAAALHLQMQAIQPVLPTPEKKWYDRVVDSILGEDPAQGAQNKYALVCEGCFRHNGLVGSKYEWDRMQWICPRCNHMNPAPISRAKTDTSAATTNLSATSAPTSSLVPPSPLPATQSLSPSPGGSPSHLPRISPRPRRLPQDRGTPGSSRLGKEVFSAVDDDDDDDEDEEDEAEDDTKAEDMIMEVDKK